MRTVARAASAAEDRAEDGAAVGRPLYVYVPAAALGPLTGIAEGSAIVGRPPCGLAGCPRPVVVSYEGAEGEAGSANGSAGGSVGGSPAGTLTDRAVRAAGRLRDGGPGVSGATVRAHDLREVGALYEPGDGTARIDLVRDERGDDGEARGLLARWLGVAEAAVDRELKRSRAERRRSARVRRGEGRVAATTAGGKR